MTLTFTESFTEFKRLIKTQFPNSQWNYMNISADINKKFPQHTVKTEMFIASRIGYSNSIHYNGVCKPNPWSCNNKSFASLEELAKANKF